VQDVERGIQLSSLPWVIAGCQRVEQGARDGVRSQVGGHGEHGVGQGRVSLSSVQ
jgi:hypothetical protein